jgi:hypothetical protein
LLVPLVRKSVLHDMQQRVQNEEKELIPSPSTNPNSYKEGWWILKEWSRFSRKKVGCKEIYRYVRFAFSTQHLQNYNLAGIPFYRMRSPSTRLLRCRQSVIRSLRSLMMQTNTSSPAKSLSVSEAHHSIQANTSEWEQIKPYTRQNQDT